MTYDANVPAALKKTQQWFAGIITRPIDEKSKINPVGLTGRSMIEEAQDFISPSPTLPSAERIQIYNQQYWWRLLTVMHDNFPTVTKLFGYFDFNQTIGVPYLQKYPSDHWSLNGLGNQLPKWIEDEYTGTDKTLVLNAAKVDLAFNESFVALKEKGIDVNALPTPGDFSQLLDIPLFLQSSVYLFELPYDLFQFRTEFAKHDADYWVDHDFPVLNHLPEGQHLYFVLFRNRQNQIVVDTISHSEYQLLIQFKQGASVEGICDWLEQQPEGSAIVEEASQQLNVWFQRWIASNLFKIN